jgi:16S rRNA (guanine966-N2)-methyltransferase
MRIIGGRFKGHPLTSVGKGDPSAHLRPTTDRVRESLFNILQGGRYGDVITDAHVLDVFAGTGALGLEALSRGAAHVTFVENGRAASRILDQNIKKLRLSDEARLIKRDALKLGEATSPPADLVFLDPPYGKGLAPKVLTYILNTNWMNNDALVVVEEEATIHEIDGYIHLETRKFGQTYMNFFNPKPHD